MALLLLNETTAEALVRFFPVQFAAVAGEYSLWGISAREPQ